MSSFTLNVKEITPTKISLDFEIPASEVKSESEKIFSEMAKSVTVKGFRKGKAPKKMAEKKINPEIIRNEVLDRLVSSAYAEGLKKEKIRPLTRPEVSVTEYQDGKPLKFKVQLERRPEIKLPDYKTLEAKVEKHEIKPEEVSKTLETLRNQKAIFEALQDAALQEGHGAVMDLEATVDGKPFAAGSGQNLLLEIQKDRFVIPEFMTYLVGKKAGETAEFDVKLPENFGPEFGGKTAHYKVKIHSIKEKKLPALDDAFAQSCGDFKTFADLEEGIKKQIERYYEDLERGEALKNVLDDLSKTLDFPVPEVLVEEKLKQLERETLQQLGPQIQNFSSYLHEKYPEVWKIEGQSDEEKVNRAVSKFRDDLRPKAAEGAKVDLILDEVSARENLRITQDEVNSEIHRLSRNFQMAPESIAKALEDKAVLQNFLEGMLRAKAAILIREHLKIV